MARRGKEVQLQQEIETQEEWEDMLSKEGVCVVDIFQEWSGTVTPIVPNLRRLKFELGDDLLRFAVAKCDTIDALEKYRGRCEPCFLFFAGGVLVAIVRGANAPLILRTITEQLAQEHKVLDGQADRKEIKDPLISQMEAKERQEQEIEDAEREEEEGKKEVSVVIIKPDAVESGKSDEILQEMINRGIEILRQEERQLTEDEVKEIYAHLQGEDYFDDVVKWMSSSPSLVLAITKGKTGQNIIKEFRELIGPTEVEEAKAQAPDSLRAKYGSNNYRNAVHGSDSSDTAARELAFFFPDFVAPSVEGRVKVQRTLALVRPDAYKMHKEDILANIRESGFKVAMQKEIHLSKEQAEDFYKEHEGQEYFEELTNRMSNGPLLALGLAREDAVAGWRQMLGPTTTDEAKETAPDSLRAKYALDDTKINMLHGSDSEATAKKELQYFFPIEQTVAVIKPDAYQTKDEIIEKIHDSGFRIAARKETTLSRDIAEEFYSDHKGKDYYNDLVEHMVSGPTLFMVLSREDAVDGWRSLIGPTDPSKAKEADADTIRGQFGTDTLKNAVHGSSTADHAKSQIVKIFGELHFNDDGTLQEESEEDAIAEQQQISYEPAPEYGKQDAIAEQQQISYEPAPEYGKQDEGMTQERTSPVPDTQQEAEQAQSQEAEQAQSQEAEQAQSQEQQQQQQEQKEEEPAKTKSPEPEKTKTPEPEKAKSPEPEKGKSPEPEKGKSPEPEKGKSPEPEKGKSPEPEKGKSPEPEKGKSPEPEKGKSPEPEKSKSPEPEKGKSPEPEQKEESPKPTGEGEESQEQKEDTKETEQQQEETAKSPEPEKEAEKTEEAKDEQTSEDTKETTEQKTEESSDQKKEETPAGGGQ